MSDAVVQALEAVPQLPEVKKSSVLQVRVPQEIYRQLVAQAEDAGVTLSELVRQHLLRQPIVARSDPSDVLQGLRHQPVCVRAWTHYRGWVWLPDERYEWRKVTWNGKQEWFLMPPLRWTRRRLNGHMEWFPTE